jgi:hypothetical protein
MASDTSGKLLALRAAKAQRDAEAGEALEALEIKYLELDAKMTADHGIRGVKWDIVETVEGPIGLLMGESVLWKKLQESEVKHDDAFAFVVEQACYPAPEVVKDLLVRRRSLVDICLLSLTSLHRGSVAALRGK